ncbi:hypothetical protein Q649_01177 [Bartonella quintana JK 73]|uniref:ABC transmembrane type-1 domain-containing protein n=1 Tax=Bartonella quintana JK 73 TaxID=1402976 RepID=W3TXQ4_BARQI|nr:ATP-binding cassette domain-containing protein [Bartonella quintana]ETS14529.1 hypothetical protein Q650_01169 [Bartonella quintana JK 73rel]ETS16215.1 hypothetical protein Q649_01177 [Bartonella quintana JK 73]
MWELSTRIGAVDKICRFLTGTIATTVLNVLFAIICLAALFSIGPFLHHQLRHTFILQAQSRLIESFTNLEVIKTYVKELAHTIRIQETLARGLDQSRTTSKFHLLNGALSHILVTLSSFRHFHYFFGAQAVLQNQITLEQLIAFHLLASNVSSPVLSLASLWEEWQHLKKISRFRLDDILNSPIGIGRKKPSFQLTEMPHLEAKDICFSYGEKLIINHLDICLQPGKPIMLLSPSGCGKSTLAKIIYRLYSLASGQILINGQSLQNFDIHSMRKIIVYFPQKPCLFSGTILENRHLAKPDASNIEINAAFQESACHDLPCSISSRAGHLDETENVNGPTISALRILEDRKQKAKV